MRGHALDPVLLKLVELGVPFPATATSSTSATRPPRRQKPRRRLYTDLTGGVKPLPSCRIPSPLPLTESPLIQELWFEDGTCRTACARAHPEDDDFFENVWRSYRETENVD